MSRLDLTAATKHAIVATQLHQLIGLWGRRLPLGSLDELRYLLVGADEDALSLVVEVGAVADPLQVFQSERRAAVGHEPATPPCDIVRAHHRWPGRTGSFRFAACGHRQRDEIADRLQRLAVFTVVPDEPLFQHGVVAGIPGVAEDDALDAGRLAFGPPEAEVSCD